MKAYVDLARQSLSEALQITGILWLLLTWEMKPEAGRPFSRAKAQSMRDAVARIAVKEKMFTTMMTIVWWLLAISIEGRSLERSTYHSGASSDGARGIDKDFDKGEACRRGDYSVEIEIAH